MKWLEITEIVSGFVLRGKIDPNAVNPDDLYPPYSEIVPILRDGGSREDVVTKCGYSIVRDGIAASESVNGDITPLGWVNLLKQGASKYKSGTNLKKIAQSLENGEDVELGKALEYINAVDFGYRGLTPMSDVEEEKNTWTKTGYRPIDECVGGLPTAGLVLIAASPGIGKTTLGLKIAAAMVRKYKRKKVVIFTLEMLMSQITKRYREIIPDVDDEEKSRILLSETCYTVGEIHAEAAKAAASEKLSAVIIDFADLMVEGEQTESVMGRIYRNLSVLAKQIKIPVILICQLNRATYVSGMPRINHIRYSGMAEAMASLILLLYNPNQILADIKQQDASTNMLPAVEGRGYILIGKSRFGFLKGGPGAIQVEWDGKDGWGENWFGYTQLTAI
jgi:hypothetical protein